MNLNLEICNWNFFPISDLNRHQIFCSQCVSEYLVPALFNMSKSFLVYLDLSAGEAN